MRFNLRLKASLKRIWFLLPVLLAVALLLVQTFQPKEIAKGDVDASNTDNVWAGTLGPAAVGIATSDVEIVNNVTINPDATSPGVYKAGLGAGLTSGFIRSKAIDVTQSGTLKNWRELTLGISRPIGTTTNFTVDILCGSNAAGCIVNQVLLANVPLSSDKYTFPGSFTTTIIKIQVNFSRPDTINPVTTLYNWQANWEVNSGVSLAISKSSGNPTPNTANPELLNGTYPGVNNYNQVTYTASYSLNRSVTNLRIEIPFPTGTYTPASGSPKNYGVTYVGSSGSNTCVNGSGGTVSCSGGVATKTIFNLGNKGSGTVGSVTVTFKVNAGPPNGVIFKTKPVIVGDDYPAQTLPDDVLNIESRAFTSSFVIAPEYIAANRDFHYIVRMVSNGLFQSDMFNARYVLNYSGSTCFSNTVTPILFGSGAASTNINTAGRTITFNITSPVTPSSLILNYGVRLRANSTCAFATGIPANLTYFSDQDASFVAQKTTNAIYAGNQSFLSKFDSSDVRRHQIFMDGPPALVGAGQRIDYNMRFEQRTSFPTANFWALYKVPSNTTFVAARLGLATLTGLGATPNNWRIYYSTSTANPPSRSTGWTELTNGTPTNTSIPPCGAPYGCFANPAPAQKITWIKYELGGNAFQWDRHTNFDQVIGTITVVSDSNANGTITANAYAYSGSTCLTAPAPCPLVHTINVNNQPYFNVLQTPCITKLTTYIDYSNCGNVTASSGGSYYAISHVDNSHESGPNSRGDATNVRVRIRLPDRQFLNPTTPIDLSGTDGPAARCETQFNGNDTNCPNASGVNQNPASWLSPSLINCSAATGPNCFLEWQLPILYSVNTFPTKLPHRYNFYVKVNVRAGVIDQTKICETGLGPCNVDVPASTPVPQNANLPKLSPYTVTVSSSPTLTLQKTIAPGYPSVINYQNSTRFRINYRNLPPSTGAVSSVTIIERLPIFTDVQPPARLNLDPNFLPNNAGAFSHGEVAYYKLQDSAYPRTSNTPPPKNDPGWVQFTGSFNPSLIPLIDWVKWERSSLLPVDNPSAVPPDDGDDFIDLGLVDGGSPDDTVLTNKAFLIWTGAGVDQSAEATANIKVDTPGFVTTSMGDVGSVGNLGTSTAISMSSLCTSAANCNTTYLGIAGATKTVNSNFKSFKDWLISDYQFSSTQTGGIKTNYTLMDKEYGRSAVACDSENTCLNSTDRVVKYTVESGEPLQINTVGSYANATYTGVPKMVFVDAGSNGSNDALEINTEMRSGDNTGLIFVVNGNVKVAYGVQRIDGVFLVEGQFSTGRRTALISNGQAGQFSTISIGRDGFARIAYLSGNNVRFIKCLDINCTTKDYGFVTTVVGADVNSVSMGLYETGFGATIDYPKIVVGMKDSDGVATTKFISCFDKNTSVNGHKEGETCLDNDTVVYPDANDPDIIVASDGIPAYTFGVGQNNDRALSLANCRINWPSPDDPNCPSPLLQTLDGGSGVNKGNETSFSHDPTTGVFGSLVATYVDRSAGRSDLWFAKLRYDNLGTGCSAVTNWDCKRIVGSAGSPGNVGAYHSSVTHVSNGLTRLAFRDTSNNQIKYLQCNNKTCDTPNTVTVDCSSGCQGQDNFSLATFGSYTDIAYNVSVSGREEVKVGFCASPGSCGTSAIYWATNSISYNPGRYTTNQARVYNQSLALGRVVEPNMPRVVFFDFQSGNNFLIYARCTDLNCTPSGIIYSFIDDGTAVSLPDVQLTLNGAVYAYGAGLSGSEQAINLERDLFGLSTSTPGEVFTLQPKYFYLFKEIAKSPLQLNESPP